MDIQIFVGKMLTVADGIGMLQWYREDLTVIDAEIMGRAPDLDYIWVVSDTSSNIIPVGLHERYADELDCILKCRSKVAIYQVNPIKGIIRPITAEKSSEVLKKKPMYKICPKTNKVSGPEGDMGWLVLEGNFIPRQCKTEVVMRYVPNGTSRLTQGLALQLALVEAEKRFGLWFYLIPAESQEQAEAIAA